MGQKGHRRPRLKLLAAACALVLGGGGVAVVAGNANAGQDSGRTGEVTATIDCPDVGDRLTDVPDQARAEVDQNLAQLDGQVADAYRQLAAGQVSKKKVQKDALLGRLKDQRATTIRRVSDVIGRSAGRPQGLDALSGCTMKEAPAEADPGVGAAADAAVAAAADPARDPDAARSIGQKRGPAQSDFVNIAKVRPNVNAPAAGRGASTGSFSSQCGRNENGHFNPDNVIVAPGVSNGAHHMHDYVGNKTTDAFSSNNSLAASGTTCGNGDQSAYYWPVLRLRDGKAEKDAKAPGGGQDANVGTILRPKQVTIDFKGSPVGQVKAMPRFLRIITGDAKAFTNGTANANASWSCTGFEDRQLKDKYPICPKGSDVVRTFTFQSCWDGRNTDSANHRTHVAFADKAGRCPKGFAAIPQLVQRITYGVAPGARFAVDSFPEQLHKPVTDHGDFINVMSNGLMAQAVNCINGGRTCR
ncbi:hypothetical protein Slala03_52610 [Streptomyces lavendulae subsp. lavendulae]|uniref:DUF1996 domain-containing protein n=1 Tax=Streptomyces lavendulae TaxID=1914 RepID=UPI0024A01E5F|nr:DUF1996 domain-containing protein [Streptomyces lavendulae]GLV85572.1 hypothetical protein Slala03_52610 [Streptomyces lavendulae subsp. lavendulae]GLX37008.1 hypothetical protein Sros01_30810 [Streptomyces roseochromogenus]